MSMLPEPDGVWHVERADGRKEEPGTRTVKAQITHARGLIEKARTKMADPNHIRPGQVGPSWGIAVFDGDIWNVWNQAERDRQTANQASNPQANEPSENTANEQAKNPAL